ncbi:MAG: hypothetical protein ACO1RX_10845 [Candidatus Sericytochromatia bacterium]
MRHVLFLANALLLTSLLSGCPAPGTPPEPTPSASSSATVSANVTLSPSEIATFVGMSATNCDQESSLKSERVPTAAQVAFKNSSSGTINIYWLDFEGKRVSYKQDLAAGATHNQGTFVTHPWVITNDQDQCLGIYTPTSPGSVSLDVKQTVTVSGGASVGANVSGSTTVSGPVTTANVTEARVREGLACLKAKGKSEAVAVEGVLNVYTRMAPTIGAAIAAQGYLAGTVSILNANGC